MPYGEIKRNTNAKNQHIEVLSKNTILNYNICEDAMTLWRLRNNRKDE